jgi:hypothetical protein
MRSLTTREFVALRTPHDFGLNLLPHNHFEFSGLRLPNCSPHAARRFGVIELGRFSAPIGLAKGDMAIMDWPFAAEVLGIRPG